jgi:hypothetical protein
MFLNCRTAAAGMLVALLAATALAAPVPAERVKAEKELAAFATKLHGTWDGNRGCQGRLILQADGTYEWKFRGPGGDTDTGVWEMRGDPQSPTLSLKCKTSDDPTREGKTVDMKNVRVSEPQLVFKSPEATGSLAFTRAMEPPKP